MSKTTWVRTEPVNLWCVKHRVKVWCVVLESCTLQFWLLLLDRAASQAPAAWTSTLLVLCRARRRQSSRAASALNTHFIHSTPQTVYQVSNIKHSSLSQLILGATWEYLQVISGPASWPCTAFSYDCANLSLHRSHAAYVCVIYFKKPDWIVGFVITYGLLEIIQHQEQSLLLNQTHA